MSIFNLKQLAEHLGLSQTTVSRALNGFPEVSEKTRLRVQEAARAFNYRPSPSAANLATGRAWAIGHVVPLSEHRMINPHFSDFLAGASEVYARCGYDLVLRAATPEDEMDVYRDFAERRRVDGVVLHGPYVNDTRVSLLQEIGLPFVVHGRTNGVEGEGSWDHSWLDVDNRQAFYQATRHLLDQGHRRIALLNGMEAMNFAYLRQEGYKQALKDGGVALETDLVTNADMTEPYGFEATQRLLALDTPPTAHLHASILSAMGGLRALQQAGLEAGRDVAVMTFDDCLSFLDSGNEKDIFLTAMRSSIFEAGQAVAEMLMRQIAKPNAGPEQVLWEANFVAGHSVHKGPFA
ncbi:MAG: substrate-binding domain-containing protein [Pseudomonadota bacterium]